MEKMRYTNRLFGIFDLPHSPDLFHEGNGETRIMMEYDRTTNVKKFEILDKGIPSDAREKIALWLHKSNYLRDVIDGLT